jgi:hypothetical protein
VQAFVLLKPFGDVKRKIATKRFGAPLLAAVRDGRNNGRVPTKNVPLWDERTHSSFHFAFYNLHFAFCIQVVC